MVYTLINIETRRKMQARKQTGIVSKENFGGN
jgi:hypothetical protein